MQLEPNPQRDWHASTSAAYDNIARKYADMWFDNTVMEPMLKEFMDLLPAPPVVLDAGCGPGRDVQAMQQRGAEAIGIDFSDRMLQEARRRVKNALFRKMDCTRLNYPASSFTGVWACSVLLHIPPVDAQRALREFSRVLAPDGILFLNAQIDLDENGIEHTDHVGRYLRIYSPIELLEMLRQAGFSILSEGVGAQDKSTLGSHRRKVWSNVIARKAPGNSQIDVESCLLCSNNRFDLNREVKNPASSSILWGDDDFYVTPDIAPLTEGHLLLATASHWQCYGACPSQMYDGLRPAQKMIRKLFRFAYGRDAIFVEHGPARRSKAGACIDHAHLHCLPLPIDIKGAVEALLGPAQRCTWETLHQLHADGQSYLYIETAEGQGYFFAKDILPSQFLRQVIASALEEKEWRWHSSYRLDVTRERFYNTLTRLLPLADELIWERTPPYQQISGNAPEPTLRGIGERKIVQDLIAPRFSYPEDNFVGIGDDCAVIPALPNDHSLVFTTDPCPTPVVCLLEPPDFYHYGWFTVLINVSDLAAMGAAPLGLLVSTVMREDMLVKDYERFLEGLSEASKTWNCPIIGGNIKDGPEFTASGSALGVVNSGTVMLRTGMSPGDRVYVIGEMGLFWSACLLRMIPGLRAVPAYTKRINEAFYRPKARIKEGIALAKSHAVTSCMDSSDGVIGCLREFALQNGMSIVVDNDLLQPDPAVHAIASSSGIDPRKLMLSWGDWELVCAVKRELADQIEAAMRDLGTQYADIGEVQEGPPLVYIRESGQLRQITNFASERFSDTSFFSHGLNSYLEFLKTAPFTNESKN